MSEKPPEPEQPPVTPEELTEAELAIRALVGDEAAQDRVRVEQAAEAHRQIQEGLKEKRRRDNQ